MSIAEEVAKLEQRRLAGDLTQEEFEAAVARVAAGLRPPEPPPAPPARPPMPGWEPETEVTTDGDLRVTWTDEGVPDPFGGIPPLPPTVQTAAVAKASPRKQASEDAGSGPGRVAEPVPSRLGAYKLVELVGQGGMGLVYAAKHLVRPGLFAVKLPRPHLAADADFVRRFRREARVGLKLDHPGIVKVHDLIIDGEYPAMVMDFVTGANLDTVLRNSGGPLNWARTTDIFGQVLEAVAYAHEQGCIHRDLKPKNIIVRPDGRALITDFGLARLTQGESTQTDMLLGTATYLAPEVYAAGAQAGPQSDIYALGMTLYKMLVGRLPFEPGTPAYKILRLKEAGEVPPPSTFQPTLPPALDALVMRAIDPDPTGRFADCPTFGAELRLVMSGVQSQATAPLASTPALAPEATLPFTGPPATLPRPHPSDEGLDDTLDGTPADVFDPTADETLDPTEAAPRRKRSHVAPTVQAPAVGRQQIKGPEPMISTKGRRIIGALAGFLLVAVLANVYLLMNDETRSGGLLLGPGGDRFGAALTEADRRAAAEAGLSEDLPPGATPRPVAPASGDVDWDTGNAPGTSVPFVEDTGPTAAEKGEQVREAVARELTAAAARDAVTREHGILHLSSSPASKVEVDGVDYGSTEITREGIPMPEGKHVVRFRCVSKECEGLKRRGAKKTIVIEPGRRMRFHADFYRLNKIDPPPSAEPAPTPDPSPAEAATPAPSEAEATPAEPQPGQ